MASKRRAGVGLTQSATLASAANDFECRMFMFYGESVADWSPTDRMCFFVHQGPSFAWSMREHPAFILQPWSRTLCGASHLRWVAVVNEGVDLRKAKESRVDSIRQRTYPPDFHGT